MFLTFITIADTKLRINTEHIMSYEIYQYNGEHVILNLNTGYTIAVKNTVDELDQLLKTKNVGDLLSILPNCPICNTSKYQTRLSSTQIKCLFCNYEMS